MIGDQCNLTRVIYVSYEQTSRKSKVTSDWQMGQQVVIVPFRVCSKLLQIKSITTACTFETSVSFTHFDCILRSSGWGKLERSRGNLGEKLIFFLFAEKFVYNSFFFNSILKLHRRHRYIVYYLIRNNTEITIFLVSFF